MPATRVSQGQTFKVLAIVEAMSRRKGMWLVAPLLALLCLLPAVRLVHYIYFDRSGLPDLERFIRFEIPTTGEVYDAQGTVLVELAREYRRVVSYDEVPPVLRDAILAAEDRNFFTHSGVEYRALPRVVYKTIVHSVAAWGNGRYGFAAASEYYFGMPLSSYTAEDAGNAALLAGITKSPRDYAPVPGDPRPLRRRNEILALMARNGFITADVAKRSQAEPVLVATENTIKTQAPAAINTVFAELKQHGFAMEDLFQGRILVHSTVDEQVQTIVNEALENGLALYEERHPEAKGVIQGSVVVLRNADAAILAEAGGRRIYKDRHTRYSDLNRATGSLRQPGSAWKPLVYLAAFRQDLDLDTTVPDQPTSVPMGANRPVKWITNYDHRFKGPIPMRQALAESRNAVAVWITRKIGVDEVITTSQEFGIRTPLQPYITTALGASEVRLLELAGAYRAMASGILAEPHIIDRVTDAAGAVLYEAFPSTLEVEATGLSLIQEGLRGVVRLPGGTAHALDGRDFLIPVMGKTGTTSDFRDALFVGSTYGPAGITVAVRIGFDDNRTLGDKETGGRTALPIFREIMLRAYRQEIVGPVPEFPRAIEERIDQYLVGQAALKAK